MQDPKSPPIAPAKIDPKKALDSLGLKDDDELDLDKFEDALIEQTDLAKEFGAQRAKLFFRSMTTQESGGKEDISSVKEARGKYQVTDKLSKSNYKGLDNTNPALNRYMGIDYWNEGYRLAGKYSNDPVEKAAIATSYFHGGPGALKNLEKSGGYISKASDTLTTTNDHVFNVMSIWKKNIEDEGLDFSLLVPESNAPTEILDTTPEPKPDLTTSRNFFSGQIQAKQDNNRQQAPDPRLAKHTYTVKFTPQEQAQYAKSSPEQRREMLKGSIASYLGGDKKKALEAIDLIRGLNPTQFDTMLDTSIGSVGEIDVDTALEEGVRAYQAGGINALADVMNRVKKDRENIAKEETERVNLLQQELDKIRTDMFSEKGLLKDPLDKTLASSASEGILKTLSGGAGILAATAGRFGLNELDRQLSQFSKKESEKARVLKETQEYIQNKQTQYPDLFFSGAKQLGNLPMVMLSAASGGSTGVYLQSLAQAADQPPLEALMNAHWQAAMLGSAMPGGKLSKAEFANFMSKDMLANSLQVAPGLGKNIVTKIYAAYNPGKLTKRELDDNEEQLRQNLNDLVAGLGMSGAFSLAHKKGSKVSVADTDNLPMPRLPEIFKGLREDKVRVSVNDIAKVRPKAEIENETNERNETKGAIASLTAITHPDVTLRDGDNLVIGRVLTGVKEIIDPNTGETLHYAQFIDKHGNELPLELLTEEGAQIYKERLRNIGELAAKGESAEKLVTIIQESQPTELDLGVEKVNKLLDYEYKDNQAETLFFKGKSDETITIYKNPTSSEVSDMNSRYRENNPGARGEDEKIRSLYDSEGNEYSWMASEGLHGDIVNLLRQQGIEGLSKNKDIAKDPEAVKSQPEFSQDPNAPHPNLHVENINPETARPGDWLYNVASKKYTRITSKDIEKAKLVPYKHWEDEPDFITNLRKSIRDSASGQQANMGANIISQAIVYGYDAYRKLKEVGGGFKEWLGEMMEGIGKFYEDSPTKNEIARLQVRIKNVQDRINENYQILNGPERDVKVGLGELTNGYYAKRAIEEDTQLLESDKAELKRQEAIHKKETSGLTAYLPDIYEKLLFLDSTKTRAIAIKKITPESAEAKAQYDAKYAELNTLVEEKIKVFNSMEDSFNKLSTIAWRAGEALDTYKEEKLKDLYKRLEDAELNDDVGTYDAILDEIDQAEMELTTNDPYYRKLKEDTALAYANADVKAKELSVYQKELEAAYTERANLERVKEDYTFEFSGDPVKLYHATSAGMDWEGYNKAVKEYESKYADLASEKGSILESIDKFQDQISPEELGQYLDRLNEIDSLIVAGDKERPNKASYQKGFDEFSTSKYGTATDIGWYGIGIYLGDLEEASKYVTGEGSNIRPVYANIKNPLIWHYSSDSSMQRWLGGWKIEDGKVLSPTDRIGDRAWKLPKEIHADAERFVRDYLEDKFTLSDDEIRAGDIYKGLIDLGMDDDVAITLIKKTDYGPKSVKETRRLTQDELHQLSRGITTIMKDKGYDGVFVIEEREAAQYLEWNDVNNVLAPIKLESSHFDTLKNGISVLVKEGMGSLYSGNLEMALQSAKGKLDLNSQYAPSLADLYRVMAGSTQAGDTQKLFQAAGLLDKPQPSYRIKEFVAFHPDQLLSAFEGWTPRNVETGELLATTSKEPNAIQKFLADEEGVLDLNRVLELSREGYAHMSKFGRVLNRKFVSRIKGVRAGGELAKNTILTEISDRQDKITAQVDKLRTEYLTALPARKTSITAEMKRLNKEVRKLAVDQATLTNQALGEEAGTAWVKSFSAQVQSKKLLLDFAQKAAPLLKSLGTNLEDYYKYRAQDRLEGARQRYIDWAKSIYQMTPDDLIHAFVKPVGVDFYNAVRAMNDVAPGSFEDAKTLLNNLREAANTGDYSLITKQLENTFTLASQMIPTDIFPDYHKYRANNRLDQVNALYKSTIADPLRVAFDATDSVPSAYLGNDNLYYPLIAETPQGSKVVRKGIFRRAQLEKPKSPAAKFTTGLSGKYDTNIHEVQKTMSAIIRAGDRATFIQRLMDLGIARPLGQHKDSLGKWVDDDIPEGWSTPVEAGPQRLYTSQGRVGNIQYDRTSSRPVKQVILPKELYDDVKVFLEASKVYSEDDVNKLVGKLTGIAILGVLEPAYHSWNVIDGLRAQLGWLPTDIWSTNSKTGQSIANLVNKTLTSFAYSPTSGISTALGSTLGVGKFLGPLTDPRTVYSIGKIMSMNLFSPDQIKRDKMWNLLEYLYERGSIPERIGHTTYSPEIANQMGAHLVGPMQYKAVRDMYAKFTGKGVPDPTIDPAKFQEGSWWDEKFTGTKWEKPLTSIKRGAQTFSMSPLVFGWNGIDLRARLAVAETLQHYAPNISPSQTFEILSLLGVYNRFAESELGNFLKRTQLAPFYSASSARSRRVFQAWNPATPYGAKRKLMQQMDPSERTFTKQFISAFQESSYAYLAMWAIASHSLTGKWPWEDEESRLLKLKIDKESIKSNKLLASLMPNPDRDGYVSFAPYFGGISGTSMFGLDGMYKAFIGTSKDPRITVGEKFDLGRRIALGQIATSYAHVVGSGPIMHLGPKLLFNVEPAIYYVPSTRGGGEYKLLQHKIGVYGAKGIAKQVGGTLLELNAMLDNMAGFVDMSPNEFESADNPSNSEAFKFMFQLTTHNFIKSQENARLTNATLRTSILMGRTPVKVRKGNARKLDNEQ